MEQNRPPGGSEPPWDSVLVALPILDYPLAWPGSPSWWAPTMPPISLADSVSVGIIHCPPPNKDGGIPQGHTIMEKAARAINSEDYSFCSQTTTVDSKWAYRPAGSPH